jgi:hypothetical protein
MLWIACQISAGLLVTVCGPHRIGRGKVAQREAASMDVYAGLCNARPPAQAAEA